MTYTTGVMAGTANPALDMATILHPLLTGNGYTFVEDWTSASETVKVYKSTAAANGVGDWYLYLRRTSDSMTGLQFTVSEAWDATNKKIQKYIPAASSPTPSAAANYTINDAVGQLPNTTASIQYFTLNTAAAGVSTTSYWVSVTSARMAVGTRTTVDSGMYVGLGDEVIPNSVGGFGFPLFANTLASGAGGNPSTTGGGATREPATTSSIIYNFSAPLFTTTSAQQQQPWGWTGSGVELYSGRSYSARVLVGSGRATTSARALLKDALCVPGLSGTQINGDTITFNTKTYVRMASSGSGIYFDPTV